MSKSRGQSNYKQGDDINKSEQKILKIGKQSKSNKNKGKYLQICQQLLESSHNRCQETKIFASRAAKQNYIRTPKCTNKGLEYRKWCLHDQKKRKVGAPQGKQMQSVSSSFSILEVVYQQPCHGGHVMACPLWSPPEGVSLEQLKLPKEEPQWWTFSVCPHR
jgi:hypothetical protein